MQKITASLGYSGMNASDLLRGLCSVLRTFLLFRVPSLSLRQFLFVFREKCGVADRLTSRENHKVF
jgi:hypothetical protein